MTVTSGEQVEQLLAEKDIDGYVCVVLGLGPGLIFPRELIDAGKPVVICDDLYGGSGRFLGEYGRACRAGLKVVGVSSSDVNDIAKAANQFAAIKKLAHSKILDVTERDKNRLWGNVKLEDFERQFGLKIEVLNAGELNQAYENADKEKATAWAKEWIWKARHVVEPSDEELIKSGAMYVGMQNLLRERQAQAIAIDCLGLFYSQKMFAYPLPGIFPVE